MQTAQIEKIESLINTSAILTASEKTEWLALLGLMNDKQLLELEKILSSAKPLASHPPQMPKLSHIVNLPKLPADFIKAGDGPTPPAPRPPQGGEEKKPSSFASKLKAIFQEKELPAGQPELELSAKSSSDEHLGGSATMSAKPTLGGEDVHKAQNIEHGTQNKQEPKVQTAASKPFFPVKEKPLVSPQAVKPVPPVLKVPLPPMPKPVPLVGAAPTSEINPVLKPSQVSNFPPVREPQSLKSDLSDGQQINNLQDLAAFDPKTLKDVSLDVLAKKIKLLIVKYGYFEAVFNLEKSPTYKNYIGTGLNLLSGQSNFESLGSLDDDYLSKEEFEKFTDLLAKIQAS